MCHSRFFFLINQESNHHADYYHSYVISHLVTPTIIYEESHPNESTQAFFTDRRFYRQPSRFPPS
jgi:hypothetical protein